MGHRQDWSGSGLGEVADSWQRGNEHYASLSVEFLTSWEIISFSRLWNYLNQHVYCTLSFVPLCLRELDFGSFIFFILQVKLWSPRRPIKRDQSLFPPMLFIHWVLGSRSLSGRKAAQLYAAYEHSVLFLSPPLRPTCLEVNWAWSQFSFWLHGYFSPGYELLQRNIVEPCSSGDLVFCGDEY